MSRPVVRLEVLHDALRHQHERTSQAQRQKHPQRRAREIDPEVAQRRALPAGDAPDERDGKGDADGGRDEVVEREAGHLREVAHGALAAIGLPVGVRREGHRRVERQVGRERAQRLGVSPRLPGLEPQDRVEDDERHQAEEEHRGAVLGPPHLVRLVDAGQAVEQAFDRARQRVEPRAPAIEHTRQVQAERLRQEQHGAEEHRDLSPAVRGHVRTSPASAARSRDTRAARPRRRAAAPASTLTSCPTSGAGSPRGSQRRGEEEQRDGNQQKVGHDTPGVPRWTCRPFGFAGRRQSHSHARFSVDLPARRSGRLGGGAPPADEMAEGQEARQSPDRCPGPSPASILSTCGPG